MMPSDMVDAVEGKTHTSRIMHQQGGDLESSESFVRGGSLPPSIYNLSTQYALNPPYPNIHALHPLPPSAHPHTPYAPSPTSIADRGLRLRTVMVSNVPVGMRTESELKEYFEYYMSRPILVPPISPGILPRIFNWFLHRKPARAAAKRVMGDNAKRLHKGHAFEQARRSPEGGISTPPNGALKRDGEPHSDSNPQPLNDLGVIDTRPPSPDPDTPPPIIERVIICRKMTELASRVERREEYLRKLEAAHCKLARKTLENVKEFMENGGKIKTSKTPRRLSRVPSAETGKGKTMVASPDEGLDMVNKRLGVPEAQVLDEEAGGDDFVNIGGGADDDTDSDEFDEEKEQARMELLARELGPFVEEFYPDFKKKKDRKRDGLLWWRKGYGRVSREASDESENMSPTYPPNSASKVAFDEAITTEAPPVREEGNLTLPSGEKKTIWHVLHALPRSYLDPYQPLVSLSTLFRGATAPAIDYYHVKVGLLTDLIQENRSKPQRDLIPTSTAFVTFHSPRDARRCVRSVFFFSRLVGLAFTTSH